VSLYTFSHKIGPGDPPAHPEVTVSFDSSEDPSLDHLIGVFVQFLEGVSFSRGSIKKYINHEFTA
jgi:hypothetical protein